MNHPLTSEYISLECAGKLQGKTLKTLPAAIASVRHHVSEGEMTLKLKADQSGSLYINGRLVGVTLCGAAIRVSGNHAQFHGLKCLIKA